MQPSSASDDPLAGGEDGAEDVGPLPLGPSAYWLTRGDPLVSVCLLSLVEGDLELLCGDDQVLQGRVAIEGSQLRIEDEEQHFVARRSTDGLVVEAATLRGDAPRAIDRAALGLEQLRRVDALDAALYHSLQEQRYEPASQAEWAVDQARLAAAIRAGAADAGVSSAEVSLRDAYEMLQQILDELGQRGLGGFGSCRPRCAEAVARARALAAEWFAP